MHSVQVSRPRGPFEIVERDIPESGPMEVRIKVQVCGICQVVNQGDTVTLHFLGVQGPHHVITVEGVGTFPLDRDTSTQYRLSRTSLDQ
jgi:D-arabinose 1-dehydrogenase-like Zn-dependent alcohol dehydrogenase